MWTTPEIAHTTRLTTAAYSDPPHSLAGEEGLAAPLQEPLLLQLLALPFATYAACCNASNMELIFNLHSAELTGPR